MRLEYVSLDILNCKIKSTLIFVCLDRSLDKRTKGNFRGRHVTRSTAGNSRTNDSPILNSLQLSQFHGSGVVRAVIV